MTKKIIIFIIILLALLAHASEGSASTEKAKNIVFMVPDGLALSNITAARIYAFGTERRRLYLETLDQIGYQSTYSADSMVTDSAAAASAWACGEKFNNGEISYHSKTKTAPRTILELARALGKKTGLIATSTITHATPAAFGAHVGNRGCENEIARQYITRTGIDLILGGGRGVFRTGAMGSDPCGTFGDFMDMAKNRGYTIVTTRQEMLTEWENAEKLLGLFRHVSLTPAYKKPKVKKSREEPSLSEMTGVALKYLESHPQGFFLIIEGSQIDWANHANNLEYQIRETLEFDQAVKVVLDWISSEPSRKSNTLVVIVSDHDCGGFAIKGPKGSRIKKSGQYVKAGWIWGSHTGEDTMIWSQGPFSGHLGRAIDNTDVFHIMRAAIHGEEYKQEN